MNNKSYSSPIQERERPSKSLHEPSSTPLQFFQVPTRNTNIKILQANYLPTEQKKDMKNTMQQPNNNVYQQNNGYVSPKQNNKQETNSGNHPQNKVVNQPTYFHAETQNLFQECRTKQIQTPTSHALQPANQYYQQNQSKSIPPKNTIQNQSSPILHQPISQELYKNVTDINKQMYVKPNAVSQQATYYQNQQQYSNRNQQYQQPINESIRSQTQSKSPIRTRNFFDGQENINDDDGDSTFVSSRSTNLTVSQIRQDKIRSPYQSSARQFSSLNSIMKTITNKCHYCNQSIKGTQILLQCNHFYCENCLSAHVESLLIKLKYSYLKCLCGQRIKLQFLDKYLFKQYQDQVSKAQLNIMMSQYEKYIEKCSNRTCNFFWVKSNNRNYNQLQPFCPCCLQPATRGKSVN